MTALIIDDEVQIRIGGRRQLALLNDHLHLSLDAAREGLELRGRLAAGMNRGVIRLECRADRRHASTQ